MDQRSYTYWYLAGGERAFNVRGIPYTKEAVSALLKYAGTNAVPATNAVMPKKYYGTDKPVSSWAQWFIDWSKRRQGDSVSDLLGSIKTPGTNAVPTKIVPKQQVSATNQSASVSSSTGADATASGRTI